MTTTPSATHPRGTIRVLHVDDDPAFADLAATFLTREDDRFEVETATDASDGLELLARSPFDCIVSDYDMPGRNGIEFLEAVREDHPDLPFILFTGKGSEEVASDAISAGVSDYLQKGSEPDRYSLLANRITNLVSRYRAERRLETRAQQQHRVAALGREALAGASREALFDRAVEIVADTLDNEYANVLEYRPGHDDLLLRAGVGWQDGLVGEATVGTGDESQAGHTLRSEGPIVVEDLRTEERFRGPPLLVDHDVVSGISVIIGSPDDPWGVLGTHTTDRTAFTGDDIDFVQAVANVLANAIEQRRIETRLRETREWYQRIIEHLSDHVIIVDESAEITYCSPPVERQMGYTPEEVIGTNAFEYVHPDDQEIAAGAFAETLENPETEVSVEYRSPAKDGTYRWIEARGGNYLDDPVIEGVMVSVREITERKEYEQELERYETIVETIDDIAFVVGEDRTVEYVSPAIREYVDVPVDDLEGRPVMALAETYVADGDDPARFEATLERAFDPPSEAGIEGGPGSPERLELTLDLDGDRVVFEYQFSPLIEGGDPVAVVITMREITHRKEREQRLQETTSRLEALFENSPDMIDVLDPEGRLLDVNQRFCEELGYTEDDVLGRPIWEIDRFVTEGEVKDLLSDFDRDERRKLEGRYERRDGSTFPVEVHLLRLDIEGEDRFLAISREITERKEYEQTITALHDAAQEIFQAETADEVAEIVVEAVRDSLGLAINGVAIHDEADDVLRTIAMTDRANEVVGEAPVFEPGESLAWGVFESGEPERYEDVSTVPGRHNPDTSIRSELIVPLGEHGVATVGATEPGVFTDVDLSLVETLAMHAETALDRIERERALERSEARYRSLTDDVLDTSSVGTFILDADFEVVWINEAIEEYFGIDREGIVGADKRQLVHDRIKHTVEETEAFAETVLATYEDNSYVEEFECHVLSSDEREERWLKHWSQPIDSGLYEGGRIEHYTDITERKRREQDLTRQNERLEEFASIVSHDLRNPLTIAEGRLELAREECESEHLETIDRAHERMGALIDDLLTLARHGEGIDDVEPVDVATLAETCWRNVATAEATLVIDIDRAIDADESRLQQLLENLFRNAIEHGGEDVTVTVGGVDAGFYVEDDGPGVPADERDDVFEAGYSTCTEGTGFGLSIVKQIAEAHGWEVRITDGSEGGARFEMTGVEFADK